MVKWLSKTNEKMLFLLQIFINNSLNFRRVMLNINLWFEEHFSGWQ